MGWASTIKCHSPVTFDRQSKSLAYLWVSAARPLRTNTDARRAFTFHCLCSVCGNLRTHALRSLIRAGGLPIMVTTRAQSTAQSAQLPVRAKTTQLDPITSGAAHAGLHSSTPPSPKLLHRRLPEDDSRTQPNLSESTSVGAQPDTTVTPQPTTAMMTGNSEESVTVPAMSKKMDRNSPDASTLAPSLQEGNTIETFDLPRKPVLTHASSRFLRPTHAGVRLSRRQSKMSSRPGDHALRTSLGSYKSRILGRHNRTSRWRGHRASFVDIP